MIFRDNAPALAEMGYFVFPLRGKSEHILPNGCNGASNDLNQIEQWAEQYPDANIGIKCENLLVIDLDIGDEKDGPADFLKVAGSLGMLPSGPESMTGSGGNHLLLQKPVVDVIGQTGVKWNGRKTGIDIRVGNQYIVAPPSIHPNGKPYQWARPIVPVEELPEIPQAWIDGFLPIRGKQSPPPEPPPYTPGKNNAVDRCRPYVEKVEPSIAGQNGDTQLYKAACVIFWDFGLSEAEGMPLLQEFNARSQPPWPQNRLDYVQKIYSEASISSDYERINFIMSKLIELKSEGRCIVAISALSRQTTKAGAYASNNMGSFRGSSDLEFSSNNAFILEKSDDARYNRFLKCFKMKDDARVHMEMVFRGSRMRFEVVGTVSDDEDYERPNGGENRDTTPDYTEWDAGGYEDDPVEEAEFTA